MNLKQYYKEKLIESLIQEDEQPRQRQPHPFAEKINSLELSPEHREEALQILADFQNALTRDQPDVMSALEMHLQNSGIPRDHPLIAEIRGHVRYLDDMNRQKDLARAGKLF